MVSKVVAPKYHPCSEAQLCEMKSSPCVSGFSSDNGIRQRRNYIKDRMGQGHTLQDKSEQTPESLLCSSAETLIQEHKDAVQQSEDTVYALKRSAVSRTTFWETLEREREKLKQRSSQTIDKAYSTAVKTIDHLSTPAQREKAHSFWRQLLQIFMEFWEKAMNAFECIVQHVMEWLSNVWQKVAECWSQIRRCMQKALNWLARLF